MNKLKYKILGINRRSSSTTFSITRARREWSYPKLNVAALRSSQYTAGEKLYCGEKLAV